MESKIMQVFYGNDCLPFKDSERTIHYPMVGNTFAGSNLTTSFRFYVDRIGGTSGISWVIMSKLPNGKLGYELLSSVGLDTTLNEHYLEFNLSSYYTQQKGDVYLSLRGYNGDVTFTLVGDTYQVSGDPLIEVTGSIKLSINYAPIFGGEQILPDTLTQIIGYLSELPRFSDTITIVSSMSASILDDLEDGQIVFSTSNNCYYQKSSGNWVIYKTVGVLNDNVVKYYRTYEVNLPALLLTTLYNAFGEKPFVLSVVPTSTTQFNDDYLISIQKNNSTSQYLVNAIHLQNGNAFTIYQATYAENVFSLTTVSNFLTDTNKIEYETKANVENALKGFVPQVSDLSTTFEDLVNTYGYNRIFAFNYDSIPSLMFGYLTEDEDDNTKVYVHYWFEYGTVTLSCLLENSISDGGDTVEEYLYDNIVSVVKTSSTIDISEYQYNKLMNDNAYLQVIQNGSLNYDIYHKKDNNSFYKVPSFTTSSGVITTSWSVATPSVSVGPLGPTYKITFTDSSNQTYTKSRIDTLFSSALTYEGTLTVAQINALDTSALKVGAFYNVSDSGTITLGSLEVVAGDNICWTGSGWDKLTMDLTAYDDKFIAAGFFEVQNYNENTGEITFVYASNLYGMTYDSDTGILTIEAN